MMKTKPFYQSKTLWVQAIAIASALFPSVQVFIVENPVAYPAIFAAINVLVRFATKGKVNLFSDSGMNGGASVVICMFAALALFSLPSCSAITAGISGQALQTETLTSESGKAVDVVSDDVARAQAGQKYGLYNAGAIAERASELGRKVPSIDVVGVKLQHSEISKSCLESRDEHSAKPNKGTTEGQL